MFLPLIYLVVYTIVSVYHNMKIFINGYQRVDTTILDVSMGFPARLIDPDI